MTVLFLLHKMYKQYMTRASFQVQCLYTQYLMLELSILFSGYQKTCFVPNGRICESENSETILKWNLSRNIFSRAQFSCIILHFSSSMKFSSAENIIALKITGKSELSGCRGKDGFVVLESGSNMKDGDVFQTFIVFSHERGTWPHHRHGIGHVRK